MSFIKLQMSSDTPAPNMVELNDIFLKKYDDVLDKYTRAVYLCSEMERAVEQYNEYIKIPNNGFNENGIRVMEGVKTILNELSDIKTIKECISKVVNNYKNMRNEGIKYHAGEYAAGNNKSMYVQYKEYIDSKKRELAYFEFYLSEYDKFDKKIEIK